MCNISNIRAWFVLALCLNDNPLYHLIAGQTTLCHTFIQSPSPAGLPPCLRLTCRLRHHPLRQTLHSVAQACKWQAGAHNLRAVQLRVVNALLFMLMIQKSLPLLEIIVKEFRLLNNGLRTYALILWSLCSLWSLSIWRCSSRIRDAEEEWMRLVKLCFSHSFETWFRVNQLSHFII